jgi:hypothetical protein
MRTGDDLRDEGIHRIDANTPAEWKLEVDLAIAKCARTMTTFTAEDVRALIPEPPHPNALGARFRIARDSGAIVKIGYQQSQRPSRHSNYVSVWRGAHGTPEKT